ncbi:SoxR reducing system RseC family protein [Halothiobacillus sp. DCM-1]|uniref:SoxR reducing system RseC family protein n=1 Tax=Halothiobacillus sp. DCM-1 TaxID=3112558 RepID=UPI003246C564
MSSPIDSPRGSVAQAQSQLERLDRAYAADETSDAGGLIREYGTVVELTLDGVWVETLRQSGCQSCSSQGSCGVSVLSRVLNRRHHRVWAATDLALAVGDQVQLVLPARALVQASLLMYLLPLLGLILGAVLAQQTLAFAGASMVGALLGLLLPLLWLYWMPATLARRGHFAPQVERVDWRRAQ